jgi:hypothetical protein
MSSYQVSLQKEEKVLTQSIIRFEEENNKVDEDIAATC